MKGRVYIVPISIRNSRMKMKGKLVSATFQVMISIFYGNVLLCLRSYHVIAVIIHTLSNIFKTIVVINDVQTAFTFDALYEHFM